MKQVSESLYVRVRKLAEHYYDLRAEQGISVCGTAEEYESWLTKIEAEATAVMEAFDPEAIAAWKLARLRSGQLGVKPS